MKLGCAVVLAAAVAGPALAHDFWIEPSTFRPAAGDIVQVRLRVGMDFAGEPVRRDSRMIEKFVLLGPAGERPVVGLDGAEPAGVVRVDLPGLLVLGYRSRTKRIELGAAAFESYLREEGLERISALRAERGERGRPGREIFSRCAKSLLLSGDPSGEIGGKDADRPLGLRLELVADRNPYALGDGEALPVRILFEGRPLEGALVVAMSRGAPEEKIRARSDAQGRVTLRLPRGGVWLVKAVHMIPAPAGSGPDWESLWASLTFER